jgi:hypothetical protein
MSPFKVMKNGPYSAATFPESTALPFVPPKKMKMMRRNIKWVAHLKSGSSVRFSSARAEP